MPIRTTANDVVFCGHGSYEGGVANFALPAGVDLFITQPVGAIMTDGPVLALVAGRPIDRLILKYGNRRGGTDDFHALGLPQVYRGPVMVPNLILHDLGDMRAMVQAAIPHGPNHVVTVDRDTNLAALMARQDIHNLIAANVAANTRLRVFWAACAAATEADPRVFHNAKAVAFAALDYARTVRTAPSIDAAGAAIDYAALHPEDTAGTIAAAAVYDAATSARTQAL